MADSKLEIKVGSVSFSGEGTGEWLGKQLDKVLAKIPELIAIAPPDASSGGSGIGTGGNENPPAGGGGVSGTLAAYLKATGSTAIQVRKFLATAVWLHDTQKKARLSTTDVSSALKHNNQGRLANASDALAQNVAKGNCEKDGKKQFYVTPEGRARLGGK